MKKNSIPSSSCWEESNIFPIPIGDYFGYANEKLYLVYAPLSDNALIATTDNVQAMKGYFQDKSMIKDESIIETMETLLDHNPAKCAARLETPEAFTRLAILPNNVCNFHCSYCYSAHGRSGKVLDKEKITTTLEYFIDPKRIEKRNLFIGILGGGEPFLSWDLVQYIIEYSSLLAKKYGFSLDFSLVTNGSIISDAIIEVLLKYKVTVSISFEILEQIQNKQRGHYTKVCSTIHKLLDSGIVPKLRSTITPDNVLLQKEMVEAVADQFSPVKDVMFEAVTDADSFHSLEEIREFYSQYINHFFEAYNWGLQKDMNVECSASRNYNLLIERFCPGEFALTPEGEISMCTRITSPLDTGYEDCIYGRVNQEGSIQLDYPKFKLLSNDNVYSKEKCKSCFAKWHCGGGCMAQEYVYSEPVLELICEFTRNFTKRMILEKLERQYFQSCHISLKEFVDSNASKII